jgi:dienelactone hydrolase
MTRMLPLALLAASVASAQQTDILPGTQPLTWPEKNLSPRMTGSIDRWLMHAIDQSPKRREALWRRDTSSPEAYNKSVEANREHFRIDIGAVDPRVSPVVMERFGDENNPALVAETDKYKVYQVRWSVLEGVDAEGLLIEPTGGSRGDVVLVPDPDQTPEMVASLAGEMGCRVVIPTLVNRDNKFSGNPRVRSTVMPHREWIYRMAFEMGRNISGYEVQRVLAAVDWLKQTSPKSRVQVIGYGEGGQIAFYAAALDTRIDAAYVSGYFGPRHRVWEEPIYHNTWSLLKEFGDAEIASLIAPRQLDIEYAAAPVLKNPVTFNAAGRPVNTPGRFWTPTFAVVEAEFERARALAGGPKLTEHWSLIAAPGDRPVNVNLGSPLADRRKSFDPDARQKRTVKQLEEHVQHLLLRTSMYDRDKNILGKFDRKDAASFEKSAVPMREYFWRDVMGKIDDPLLPLNPRTRLVYDTPKFRGYDVVLDVFGEVFAWGVLLVPKDVKPGERRPVVVTQHGLEGIPADTIEDAAPMFRAYQAFSARLAERGFIVFAPHNPYRGQDAFRVLQRKAQALGLTIWSFIFAQHQQIVNFLETQLFVDKSRIAFYGLSYGGKSAMRIPAVETRYCLSICSGDYNEWVWKNATVDWPNSYMFTGEYEIYEWNLGHTFNYAEMSYLIFPRPFMVERGHKDGVGNDEWVNFEFARTRRVYSQLGHLADVEIEHFDGPHMIHGVGTFAFLHKHLNWPPPPPEAKKD